MKMTSKKLVQCGTANVVIRCSKKDFSKASQQLIVRQAAEYAGGAVGQFFRVGKAGCELALNIQEGGFAFGNWLAAAWTMGRLPMQKMIVITSGVRLTFERLSERPRMTHPLSKRIIQES